MITKEQLRTVVKRMRQIQEDMDQLKTFGIDPYVFCTTYVFDMLDLLIDSHFDIPGRDAFYGWMYEGKDVVIDSDGTKYELINFDDVWEYLTHHFDYESAE